MTKQKPFFFLHIPKTAGTSFRLGLEKYYGKQNIVYDYGHVSKETHPDLQGVFDNADRRKLLNQMLSNGDVNVIAGHVPWYQYQNVFSQEEVVVFLREPVQRVLSEYNHFVRHNNYKKGLEEFYRSTPFRNKQHFYTKGLDLAKVKFLGITEYYDESLNFFNAALGIKIDLLSLNIGKASTHDGDSISTELVKDIRRYNELDVEIYLKAVSRFCKYYGLPIPDTLDNSYMVDIGQSEEFENAFVGRIGSLNASGELFGWALDQANDKPVSIDVYLNEVKVATVRAENTRNDLVKRGLSKTGNAGFSYKLENFLEGDAISVRISGTRFELNNSPLVIK